MSGWLGKRCAWPPWRGVQGLRIAVPLVAIAVPVAWHTVREQTLERRGAIASTEAHASAELDLGNPTAQHRQHRTKQPVWWPLELARNVWRAFLDLVRAGELVVIFSPVMLAAPLAALSGRDDVQTWWYGLICWSLRKGGATTVKLGQWASHRDDLVPLELRVLLGRLRSDAPAHPGAVSVELILEELGHWPFEAFDTVPVASGSVAQVHRARLARTGEEVAVKVRHPGVQRALTRDVSILLRGAALLSHLPSLGWLRAPVSVEEFGDVLVRQADLTLEAENLETFGRNFQSARGLDVAFPRVVRPLVSSRVLTMTWEKGESIQAYIDRAERDVNTHLASLGYSVFMTMLINHNFIHGDCHAGNVLVRPRAAGGGLELVVLDAGLVSELTAQGRVALMALLRDIVKNDGAHAGQMFVDLSRNGCPHAGGEPAFRAAAAELMTKARQDDSAASAARARIDVARLISGFMSLVRVHGMVLESDFAAVMVAVGVQEKLARALDPDIDLVGKLVPFLFQNPKAALKFYMSS